MPATNEVKTYHVRIEYTSLKFLVSEGETVLQAALRQGIELPWGCGSGVCGVCMSGIVEGSVVYDTPPLALFEEDEAQGKGLICVARPCTDLVLYVPEVTNI